MDIILGPCVERRERGWRRTSGIRRRQAGQAYRSAQGDDRRPAAAAASADSRARAVRTIWNDDFDQQWRAGIQTRFVAILAEQRTKQELLAELHRQAQAQPSVDLSLLEAIPQENIDLARLPEDQQRRLYDTFHLELRYNDRTREFGLRVTITGETAAELGATVAGIAGQPAPSGSGRQRTAPDDLVAGALRARGGSRTAHQSATARGGAI
jgi:hypothetical protein